MSEYTSKRCSYCREVKPLDQFCHNKNMPDGHGYVCKPCAKEYQRKRSQLPEVKEKHKLKQREYRADPKVREHYRLYMKEYNKRPDVIERDNKRIRPPEQIAHRRVLIELWYKRHPDKLRAKWRRHRARREGAIGTHTEKDVKKLEILQKGRCWWCGKKLPKIYHVDHRIPLAKGGTDWPDNLVLACPNCNLSKSDKLPEEWIGRLL